MSSLTLVNLNEVEVYNTTNLERDDNIISLYFNLSQDKYIGQNLII